MAELWTLECSACGGTRDAQGFPTVCEQCGQPYLVRYPEWPERRPSAPPETGWSMWRYSAWLPLRHGETPVTLGEGGTPLRESTRLGSRYGLDRLFVKDEGPNPTGSFKARGLSMAVTRAVCAGARELAVPTAGNAGVATAAYARCAGVTARVFAPATTPSKILSEIRRYGAELVIIDGHIGDCGRAARSYAAERGAVDLSTLREPYRLEGKKTLGLEIAEQLGWHFPDAVVYPAGGGTGLIGIWKAFQELRASRWVTDELPRMFAVQAEGCAPIVRAFREGLDRCTPWPEPHTIAAGLRVPAPLGDRLMLRVLRDSGGAAVAVSDAAIIEAASDALDHEEIDAAPEGGAAHAGARILREHGLLAAGDRVVVCNTGAGWLYRA